MLHFLIHAQFGYLLHPSIKLPSAISTDEPLRIADVGTGTGQVKDRVAMGLYNGLVPPADSAFLVSGLGN